MADKMYLRHHVSGMISYIFISSQWKRSNPEGYGSRRSVTVTKQRKLRSLHIICGMRQLVDNIKMHFDLDRILESGHTRNLLHVWMTHDTNQSVLDHMYISDCPDSKLHGANMGPIWGRQDPDGPHVGPMKLAIWVANTMVDLNVTCTCWYINKYLGI